jgi:hypothetical protein
MDQLAKSRTINLTVADDPRVVRNQSEQFAKTAGIGLEEANQAVFSIRSLFGSEEDKATAVSTIAKAAPFARDPIALATGAGKLKSIFKDQAGSIPAIVNKLFMAASRSETDPSQFGFEMAKFMDVGKDIGATDEYLASALAYGSQGKATTSQAAERLKALVVAMDKEGVKGKGLKGKFESLLAQGVTPQNFFDFSASMEAKQGFGILYNDRDAIANFAKQIEAQEKTAGTAQSFIGQKMAQRDADPLLLFSQIKARSTAAVEIASQKDRGTLYDQAIQAAIDAARAAVAERDGTLSAYQKARMSITGAALDYLPDGAAVPDFAEISPSTVGAEVFRAGTAGFGGFGNGDEVPQKLLEVLEKIDKTLQSGVINPVGRNQSVE